MTTPYLPLARKYRPQTFEELVGQAHVTATLTRALESRRLAQAYLFTGQRGVGKTSAARILATCLNCEHGPTPTPCHRCPSCAQIISGQSLDVVEIDGASNRGIDEIRSLRETLPYAPSAGRFRVTIIDEVHQITPDAFNALLKTLEEPPAHVKFIFATTAPHKIPATILSRCQRFDFRRIETPVTVGILRQIAQAERVAVQEEALYAIARAAEGSLRDAEVIFEQLISFAQGEAIQASDVTGLLGAVEADALHALAQAILDRDAPAALTTLMAQGERGREAAQVLTGLLRHFRNLLIVRTTAGTPSREPIVARLIDEPADRLTRLEEQASRATPQELLLALQVLTGAYELVRRSPMAQTILELAVIKLATREAWQSLEEISRRLERLSAGEPPTVANESPPLPRTAEVPVAQRVEERPALDTPSGRVKGEPEDMTARWAAFLERVRQQKVSLAAYLTDATPERLEGNTLTVGIPPFALHQDVLNLPEHVRLIERLLGEVCRQPMKVQYTTRSEPLEATPAPSSAPADTHGAPAIVQDIVKLFNATLLDHPTSPAA